MEMVEFHVKGKSEPAGSKRAVPMGNRWGVIDDNPKAAKFKLSVGGVAKAAMDGREPLRGPLRVTMAFLIERPKSHLTSKGELSSIGRDRFFHTIRPDVLKLARAVEDGMTGVAYEDDAQIVVELLTKRYCHAYEEPGVFVTVEQVDDSMVMA